MRNLRIQLLVHWLRVYSRVAGWLLGLDGETVFTCLVGVAWSRAVELGANPQQAIIGAIIDIEDALNTCHDCGAASARPGSNNCETCDRKGGFRV